MSAHHFSLEKQGISVAEIHRNATPAFLYEAALKFEKGTAISSTGFPSSAAYTTRARSTVRAGAVRECANRVMVWRSSSVTSRTCAKFSRLPM